MASATAEGLFTWPEISDKSDFFKASYVWGDLTPCCKNETNQITGFRAQRHQSIGEECGCVNLAIRSYSHLRDQANHLTTLEI